MPLSIVGLNVYYWIGSLKQICTGRKIKMSETSSVLKNSQDIRKMASGSSFKAIFVVSSLFQKNDKNGKPYFEMTVTDQSGTLRRRYGRMPSGSTGLIRRRIPPHLRKGWTMRSLRTLSAVRWEWRAKRLNSGGRYSSTSTS